MEIIVVTPLAKLLEAALFASARPIATEELAALDHRTLAGRARSRRSMSCASTTTSKATASSSWRSAAAGRSSRAPSTPRRSSARSSRRVRRASRRAALETLAIIAYRQPIGRAEIEEIRGVAVGGVLKSLHERGLIDVVGRAEGLGRPLLYGTTPVFLEHFALRHLEELPRADELAIALRAPRARRTTAG